MCLGPVIEFGCILADPDARQPDRLHHGRPGLPVHLGRDRQQRQQRHADGVVPLDRRLAAGDAPHQPGRESPDAGRADGLVGNRPAGQPRQQPAGDGVQPAGHRDDRARRRRRDGGHRRPHHQERQPAGEQDPLAGRPAADRLGVPVPDADPVEVGTDRHPDPGDLVKGTVFALEPKGAMIDIGAKTAAFMPVQEVSINRVEGLNDVLQPSESREFFIMSEENEDGQLALSIRRIEYQRAWERVRQLQKEDATIYSEVFATNRGGALVRVEGLRGFIPGSHISARKIKDDLEGEYLPLKFLEVDEERNRLVLSHRRALVEKKMNRLEVGEVVVGSVKGIKPYGAFIDIGGVSGLLHISEISHEHIETPHNVLNVSDQMKVMIIDLDSERGRISLSTKALEPEPGDMLTDPQKVFSKAEEMAAKYKQMLFEQTDENENIPTASAETV